MVDCAVWASYARGAITMKQPNKSTCQLNTWWFERGKESEGYIPWQACDSAAAEKTNIKGNIFIVWKAEWN